MAEDVIMDRIVVAMKKRRLTAKDLADAAEVSRPTMYRMLNQHTDEWTLGQVRAVLKRCGVELEISI